MAINLATKYSNKVDERFEKQSQASLVTSGEYEFNGVDTVKVYSIDTVAMNDYSRTGSNRYGTAGELGDTSTAAISVQRQLYTSHGGPLGSPGNIQPFSNFLSLSTTLPSSIA